MKILKWPFCQRLYHNIIYHNQLFEKKLTKLSENWPSYTHTLNLFIFLKCMMKQVGTRNRVLRSSSLVK